jgi:hypothetical protein
MAMSVTWGVWDTANLIWVGSTTKSEQGARNDAARWNLTYRTTYYMARDSAKDRPSTTLDEPR